MGAKHSTNVQRTQIRQSLPLPSRKTQRAVQSRRTEIPVHQRTHQHPEQVLLPRELTLAASTSPRPAIHGTDVTEATSSETWGPSLYSRESLSTEHELRSPPEQLNHLLDQQGLLQLQIDGLETLNQQSMSQVQHILHPHNVPVEGGGDRNNELAVLMDEITQRNQEIRKRRRWLAGLSEQLLALGCPAQHQGRNTALSDVFEEDESLCMYCVASPIDTVYLCCGHRGACAQCAAAMRACGPQCPHCRALNPKMQPLPQREL